MNGLDLSTSCSRRTLIQTTAAGLLGCLASRSVGASGRITYDGVSLSRPNRYDYAPSVMIGDGPLIRMWWLGLGSKGDEVFHAALTPDGWTSPATVLEHTPDAWDGLHVGDPSVVTGDFHADGEDWRYAMYYTATDRADGTNSHIGVAFSNDGVDWHKYSGNPVVSPDTDPTGSYGAGMPTAFRFPGTDAAVWLGYLDSTLDTPNHLAWAGDGVSFEGRRPLPAPEGEHVGDMAWAPAEGCWYVSTKERDEVCHVYRTEKGYPWSRWSRIGSIDERDTDNAKNHNPGWLRAPNGRLYRDRHGRSLTFFGTGDEHSRSWEIGQATADLSGWRP